MGEMYFFGLRMYKEFYLFFEFYGFILNGKLMAGGT